MLGLLKKQDVRLSGDLAVEQWNNMPGMVFWYNSDQTIGGTIGGGENRRIFR